MREEPSPGQGKRSVGNSALSFGLVAVACALIPVIGDLIAAPVGVLAVVYGFIGISRYDAGATPRVLPAAAGTALGTIALFVIILTFIATRSPT